MKKKCLFALVCAAIFSLGMTVDAKEITVCSDASACDYTILREATDASVAGDIVKLKEDTKITRGVLLHSETTLDLGGFTLTAEPGTFIAVVGGNHDVKIVNGTIVLNNAANKTGQNANVVMQGATTKDGATTSLTIAEDVTINSNLNGIVIQAEDKESYNTILNLYGKVNAKEVGITINGWISVVDELQPVINIYGSASIKTTDGPAAYAAGYGTWNIKGGSFEGTEAISVKSGNINISGGIFKAIGTYEETPLVNNKGWESTGAALSITSSTNSYAKNVKLNITGGEFTSVNGNALYEGITDTNTSAILNASITDGKFTSASGKDSVKITSNSATVEGIITGGEFSTTPREELIDSNVKSKALDDGTVLVGTEYEITLGDIKNGKVTLDKTKALKGEFVKLTIEPDEGYELDKVIIHVDGEEVEYTNGGFIMVDSDAVVEVTFKAVISNPSTFDNSMNTLIILVVSALGGFVTYRKLEKSAK